MASSIYCLCSSNIVNGVPARDLSSSAAFVSGSPLSCCPPTPKSSSKHYTTKCSLSEEDQRTASVAKRALAGVVATGAALAVFTNMAIAAQGPGNEGARRVAEKADKLLKAADKLNIEDAPPRFGPGRPGGAEDPTKISQQAGSGAAASVKEGVSNATKGASDAAQKVQNKSGGFFGFGKKQSDSAKDVVSQAKGKTDEVVGSVRQAINRDGLGRFRVPKDVASNVEGAVGQAQTKQSQIANTAKGAIGQAQSKANVGKSGGNVLSSLQEGLQSKQSQITNTAKDAVGQAQSKANVGNSGGNVLSSLQEGLQGLKESAAQSSDDVKNTVQKSLQ